MANSKIRYTENDAINTQYELIKSEVGEDFVSTVTLWMEGSNLFNNGYLKPPKGSVIVFCDVGATQHFSNDLYTTDLTGYRGGVYYHVAYWFAGPHLAVGTDPEKMRLSYEDAVANKADCFSILNVSSVRELTVSAQAGSLIVWNKDAFDCEKFLRDFCKSNFFCEEAAELYNDYFDAFADGGRKLLHDWYQNNFDLKPCAFSKKVFPLNDGSIIRLGRLGLGGKNKNHACQNELAESIKKFEVLLEKCKHYNTNKYFEELFVFQIKYLISLEKCTLAIYDGNYQDAIWELEGIIKRRLALMYPPFENWYRSDEKIGIQKLINQLKEHI